MKLNIQNFIYYFNLKLTEYILIISIEYYSKYYINNYY